MLSILNDLNIFCHQNKTKKKKRGKNIAKLKEKTRVFFIHINCTHALSVSINDLFLIITTNQIQNHFSRKSN